MKIITFFTVLILIFPVSIFGSEIDNIIRQQKENKEKEAEAKDKSKRYEEAMERCYDKVTEVVAFKIKELMDKGVEFKKPQRYEDYFENIDGKRYAVYGEQKILVRTSLYDDKFIAFKKIDYLNIYFQPKNGKQVSVVVRSVGAIKTFEWKLWIFVANRKIEFKSIYDIDEIERKRDIINNNIVKAIEDAVKYGDK